MVFLFAEFGFVSFFFVFSTMVATLFFFLSFSLSKLDDYSEKLSPYECGFDPFDDARNQFEVKFYLVAILFLVFDLEASFLFPWAYCLNTSGSFGFWVIFDFFLELLVGFIYVWKIGAFNWE